MFFCLYISHMKTHMFSTNSFVESQVCERNLWIHSHSTNCVFICASRMIFYLHVLSQPFLRLYFCLQCLIHQYHDAFDEKGPSFWSLTKSEKSQASNSSEFSLDFTEVNLQAASSPRNKSITTSSQLCSYENVSRAAQNMKEKSEINENSNAFDGGAMVSDASDDSWTSLCLPSPLHIFSGIGWQREVHGSHEQILLT